MPSLWPHQESAIQQVCDAIVKGERRILLCIPTGGGKTRVAEELIRLYLDEGRKVALYTNRKMLIDQTSRVMSAAGHDHGVRAAGYADDRQLDFQVASIQTESSRVLRKCVWDLHEAELVILDEAHLNRSPTVREILQQHCDQGAAIVGLTATPIGLGDLYTTLVSAGTASELRECGALVLAHHYGPDQPDLKGVKATPGEDLSEQQQVKAVMRHGIFGRVLKWFQKLNPEWKPTLLFAPGVKESAWFAEQFTKAGIKAAHIDGAEVWLDGEWHRTGKSIRREVLDRSRDGDIKVICNRFVCLDAETEILTTDGWVGKGEMKETHQVANWEEGRIFFARPMSVIRRQRQPGETMVALETPRRSIRVTSNHRMLYRTTQGGRFLVATAGELVGRAVSVPVSGMADPFVLHVEQPDMCGNLARRITANAYAMRRRGFDSYTSRLVAERRIRDRASLRYKRPAELTIAECEFIGFWIGDGNKNELASGGVEYRMWQGADCPRIVEWVNGLCDRIGVDYVRRTLTTENGTKVFQWSMPRGTGFGCQKRRGLFALEPYLKKDGTNLFWALAVEQFEALLRGLWIADGFPHGDNIALPKARLMICGAKRAIFDLLQAIAVCRGYRASIREYKQTRTPHRLLTLSLTKQDGHALTKCRFRAEETWKEEEVWCVETDSGNIITRRKGSATVMGNCREGLDLPWIEHLILATVIGSLQSYLQVAGRGLRASPSTGKTHLTIQDHGGNWVQHGSVNADREWSLEYTAGMITGLRQERLRKKQCLRCRAVLRPGRPLCLKCGQNNEVEPIRCPECGRILAGLKCPQCGQEIDPSKKMRPVVQSDGSLKELRGDAFPPQRVMKRPDGPAKWRKMYWRSRTEKGDRTFRAAMSLFAQENFWQWPDQAWPFMPVGELDFFRHVSAVSMDRLVGWCKACERIPCECGSKT